jgi:hypothetical protein
MNEGLVYIGKIIALEDVPNYQTVPEMVSALVGNPYYITQKMDGMTSTAYKYKGHFGVCMRNFELKRDENNVFWKLAIKYDLENRLPEGYAIQWETCGPNIQSNPAGLEQVEAFAFTAYDIEHQKRLCFSDFSDLVRELKMKKCEILAAGQIFEEEIMHRMAERFSYENGKPQEGVVVRSWDIVNCNHISFKCINLNYEN